MVRDGQGCRDYGVHLEEETDWRVYDACPRCKVERGQACLDMRIKHGKPVQLWVRHSNRPLVSVLTVGPEFLAGSAFISNSRKRS